MDFSVGLLWSVMVCVMRPAAKARQRPPHEFVHQFVLEALIPLKAEVRRPGRATEIANHQSKGEKVNMQSDPPVRSRRLGRSIFAVLAGIAVGIVLSVGTDNGLHAIGLVPAQNERWPNQLLLLAAVYRSIYGVIASYIIARLAPNRPMGHSLLAGALGMLVSTLGAAAAWSNTMGQHWYEIALVLTAIPTAWVGAKLRLMQYRTETTAA